MASAGRFEQPKELASLTEMNGAFQPVHRWGPVTQGNPVLSARPIADTRYISMPRGLEHRGCLLAETEIDGVRLRFGTLHLSLGRGHRTRQIAYLAEVLPTDLPLVLAGDFNGEVADSRAASPNPHRGRRPSPDLLAGKATKAARPRAVLRSLGTHLAGDVRLPRFRPSAARGRA